ncbi:MAG TPA: hypothetical protein VK920_01135 [Solirubrobacterales bacterium]|nr:hypothetical protein [Solirubrobacterales bacterium]
MRAGGEPTEVVVCATLDAPPRGRRRRARTGPAAPAPGPAPLPLTRLTVVSTSDLGGPAEAKGWLREIDEDPGIAEAFVDRALRVVNRALRAQAASARDPYVHEIAADGAAATRIGYGEGEQVADGRWSEARGLERAEPRRRRRGAPEESQERVAAVLGGHEELAASETLLLRARLDLDQGDARAAALQLRAGAGALLAEPATGEARDEIEELRGRLPELGDAAAATGEPDPERVEWLAETLQVCERVLRRRSRQY